MASSGGPSEFQPVTLNRERRRGGILWLFGWGKSGSSSLLGRLSRPAIIVLLILALAYSCGPKAQQWMAAHGGVGSPRGAVFERRAPLMNPEERPAPAEFRPASPAGAAPVNSKAVYLSAQNQSRAAERPGFVLPQTTAVGSQAAPENSTQDSPQSEESQAAPKGEKSNIVYFKKQLTLAHGWLHSFGGSTNASFGANKLGGARPLHAVPKGFVGQGTTLPPGQWPGQAPGGAVNGSLGGTRQGPEAVGSFSKDRPPGITDGASGSGLAAGQSPCGDFKNQYAKNLFRGSGSDQTPCAAYNNLANVDTSVAAPTGGLDSASQLQAQVWDGSAQNGKNVSGRGAAPQVVDRGQPAIGGAAQPVLGDDSRSVVGGALDGAPLGGEDLNLPGTNRPPAANAAIVPKGVTASGLLLYGNKYLYGIFY